MTPEELLSDLDDRDVIFTVRGEHLRIDAPQGVLTDELRSTLSEHKPELVRLLRDRAHEETLAHRGDLEVEADQVAAMPLSVFARSGLIVRVHSEVLARDVLFVSDDVPETEIPDLGLTVYRATEMKKLAFWRPEPADLQRVHLVKEIFGQAYGASIAAIQLKRNQDEGDLKAV